MPVISVSITEEEPVQKALDQLEFSSSCKSSRLDGKQRNLPVQYQRRSSLYNYGKTMEATGQDYCLAEEFIEGQILGCEAMMKDGELVYCLPNNIAAFQSHVPTPVGHSVPYRKPELEPEICRQVKLAIEAVGLDNCPVNCDLICKDDRIYVIEITGRAGATCLPEMVGLYYGINYYEAIVRLAMGMDVRFMFRKDAPHRANLSKILTVG